MPGSADAAGPFGPGFSGELLDQVVSTVTANREAWLATMMDEELHLQPVQAPTSCAARS
jgi:hypothetical protein